LGNEVNNRRFTTAGDRAQARGGRLIAALPELTTTLLSAGETALFG
jgi:hypothetical protein